eukprot:scaffold105821_cov33-Tisochrysis_lutea.AAC.1
MKKDAEGAGRSSPYSTHMDSCERKTRWTCHRIDSMHCRPLPTAPAAASERRSSRVTALTPSDRTRSTSVRISGSITPNSATPSCIIVMGSFSCSSCCSSSSTRVRYGARHSSTPFASATIYGSLPTEARCQSKSSAERKRSSAA